MNFVVKHKYKETFIIPYSAMANNFDFTTTKEDKFIIFADGIRCKVLDWHEKHICELSDDIKQLYGKDAWSFICAWHNALHEMFSMYFLVIKVEKK